MTSISQYGYQSFIVNQLGVQRDQMNQLTVQLSTGLQSQTFGGLGSNRSLALNFQTQLDQANTFLNTINNVNTNLSILNTSVQGISQLATTQVTNFSQQNYTLLSSGVTDQQQSASNALSSMVSIFDTSVAGNYVFGGKTTNAAPVTDVDTIMNGNGIQAGFKQVMSERLQADQGVANASTGHTLGRLTVATPAANTNAVTVTEDAGIFGWKLNSVTTAGTGTPPTLTQPTGSPPATTIDFTSAALNAGNTLNLNLTGPDGVAETVQLTATTTTPAPAGSFTIGSTPAATAANFNTALQSSLNTIGNTDLTAASAEAAGTNFFNTYQGAAPQRVVPGPGGSTDFANATGLVNGITSGPTANTIAWYTGDQSATNPRQDATAQIDTKISVNFGVRANEPGFTWQVSQLAIASAFDASSGTATSKAAYLSLTNKIATNLANPPITRTISGIQTDLADAYATANTSKTRLTTQAGTYQNVVSNVENVDQTTAITSLTSLQQQMQASYEASNILLHMSLATYITGG